MTTDFYSGEPVVSKAVAVAAPQSVTLRKTFVDHLPLILAVVTLALTLYMLSEMNKSKRRRI
jgi:hypothetical protein